MELTRKVVALGLVLVGASACGEGTAPTPPATLPTAVRIDFQTPHLDDGAVVIALRGPAVSDLASASSGYLTYSRADTSQETRIIVVGDLKSGPLVTLSIPPGHQQAEYAATVQQVAARTDTLRLDLSGYRVTVTRP